MLFSADEMLRLVERFQTKKILVLGDVMVDQYWWGTVSRISPEAPVPVVHKQKSTIVPGGAANVASNVASLGGVPLLVGLVGDDLAAQHLRHALAGMGVSAQYLVSDNTRPTTIKTRVVAHAQHVVRVDDEERVNVEEEIDLRGSQSLGQLRRAHKVGPQSLEPQLACCIVH